MPLYDYLIYLSHPSVEMKLTDNGWQTKGILPVKKEQVEKVYKKYFKPQKSWPNTLYSEGELMEFSAYFNEDNSDQLEDIHIRVSLTPTPDDEVIKKISQTIFEVAEQLQLKPFDVYRKQFVNSAEEITGSIYQKKIKRKRI